MKQKIVIYFTCVDGFVERAGPHAGLGEDDHSYHKKSQEQVEQEEPFQKPEVCQYRGPKPTCREMPRM